MGNVLGVSAGMNPNESDIPSYGATIRSEDPEDQQVMGAQSTATAATRLEINEAVSRGFLDLDGETTGGREDQLQYQEWSAGSEGRPEERNPGVQLNGKAPSSVVPEARSSQMGIPLSEVTMAAPGAAQSAVRGKATPKLATPGASSTGTIGTVGTAASGYVTAVSEGGGGERKMTASDQEPQRPLFSAEQAERLESLAKAAPLLFPEASAPEIPHSVSSGSGDAIQLEVRRQLQQFMSVQSELERRVEMLQSENEKLRRGEFRTGVDHGVRGWLGGIGRGIMGLVQQVPSKAGHPSIMATGAVATVTQVSSNASGPGVPLGIPAQVPGGQQAQVAQVPGGGQQAQVAQVPGGRLHRCPDCRLHRCPEVNRRRLHRCPEVSHCRLHRCPEVNRRRLHRWLEVSHCRLHRCPEVSRRRLHRCPEVSHCRLHRCPEFSRRRLPRCPEVSRLRLPRCPEVNRRRLPRCLEVSRCRLLMCP